MLSISGGVLPCKIQPSQTFVFFQEVPKVENMTDLDFREIESMLETPYSYSFCRKPVIDDYLSSDKTIKSVVYSSCSNDNSVTIFFIHGGEHNWPTLKTSRDGIFRPAADIFLAVISNID